VSLRAAILSALVIAAVALSIALPMHVSWRHGIASDARSMISAEVVISDGSGRVVWRGSDPLTKNFFVLVTNYFLGQLAFSHSYAVSASGKDYASFYTVSYDSYGNEYAHPPTIELCVGNGTGTASYLDTKLFSEVSCQTLSSSNVVVNDTGTAIVIYYRTVFNFTNPINITEAGLYLYSSSLNDRILIAHDTFPPVLANTTIAVEYVISIDYSKPPFTKAFWELVANNYLGLGSLGLGFTSVPSVDLANTNVELEIGVNNASYVAWSPTVSLTSVAYLEKPLAQYPHVESTSFGIDALYSPPASVPTYGLAIELRFDSNIENEATAASYTTVLIAYIPVAQTVLDPTKYAAVSLRVYVA